VDGLEAPEPIALRIEVSRQLRTAYSPPPGAERVPTRRLKALVVGDPGDPARKHALRGARDEALAVARLLAERGVEVTTMIGAPATADRARPLELDGIAPADRLAVLMALARGDVDLLHYAGHGDFDPAQPDATGWIFADGLLTPRLLDRVDVAPSLVVANACLSARTSDALARGAAASDARTEADLLPGLADEFFRRGVRNYVGTAWKVHDRGALEFACAFYDALLPVGSDGRATAGASVGGALRRARTALVQRSAEYGALWAAYQHYGDPQHVLRPEAPAAAAPGAGSDSTAPLR
jgi:hypothetical protein